MINTMLPLLIMTVCNAWTSYGWFAGKNYAMGVVFICYAVATTSFTYIAWKGIA
jgi:hypothetical protein